jgi:large subunit ribosomal protein L22
MQVTAKLKSYHVAPRKVRLVIDTIRGLGVVDAINQLDNLNKRASGGVLKLLNSAIANAVNNFSLEKSNLYIKTIFVGQGMVYKRWMPKAHGTAGKIRKVTSHVTIILDERIPTDDKKKIKKQKTEEKEDVDVIDIKEIKKESSQKIKPINKEKFSINKPQQKSKSIKSFIRKAGDK